MVENMFQRKVTWRQSCAQQMGSATIETHCVSVVNVTCPEMGGKVGAV
jgi:hypothetical protein